MILTRQIKITFISKLGTDCIWKMAATVPSRFFHFSLLYDNINIRIQKE